MSRELPNIKNPVPNKWSSFDTDHEHLSYSHGGVLPPRVLRPQILKWFGFEPMWAKALSEFTNLRLRHGDKSFYFTGVKTIAIDEFFIYTPLKKAYVNPKFGDVNIYFDTSVGSGKTKSVVSFTSLPGPYQRVLAFYLSNILNEFKINIWPYHAHFILKDSLIYPLPFKYFECRIKSSTGNQGNIFADIQTGTTFEDSVEN